MTIFARASALALIWAVYALFALFMAAQVVLFIFVLFPAVIQAWAR